ncbi:PD-(D/E)XK nuclease family protein [Planctomycetota bacterium]
MDADTNIKLTGVMDDLFMMEDGSYFIVDYKTARFTKNADKLLPLYKVQLNGYAYIFEQLKMGSVGGLLLVYYEPMTEVDVGKLDSLIVEGGFRMGFKAHLLKIDLDANGVVLPLLKVVRELGDRPVAPMGRENCKDCGRMGEIVNLSLASSIFCH